MLKGVNKLIIEVSNPESDYFERAIFFVKPDKSNAITNELNENVRGILKKADEIGTKKTHGYKKHALLKLAGAASLGAAAAGIIMKVL